MTTLQIVRTIRSVLFGSFAKKMIAVGVIILAFILVLTFLAPYLTPNDPTGARADGQLFKPFQEPNKEHPMGTNDVGLDVYTRVLYGGRVPLLVATISTLFALLLGVPLGLLSGYLGGFLDKLLSLVMDSLFAFPGLILAIAITAMIGPSISNTAIAIAVIYVPVFFRVVRSQVLSIKELLYVEAAKSIGESTPSIIFRYILPNTMPGILVILSMGFADAILIEAGLSFVGLSTAVPPAASWGLDVAVGRNYLLSGFWWIITFPGLMLIFATLGFSLISEGLNDLANPKLAE